MTDLSVVIPTHRRDSSLEALLLALGEQYITPNQFEVVVAIDGPSAETEALLAGLPVDYPLRWVGGPRGGPGVARNRGAAAANGRRLLFLDDDMLPAPNLLAVHWAGQQDQDKVVCLGRVGLLPGHDLSPWEQYLNRHFEQHYDKMGQAGYTPTFWDCLSGNLSLPRRLFQESRGFDPIFGHGKHEDIELGYRLHGLGARFYYQPRALSHHRFAKSQAEGLQGGQLSGASTLRFLRRCPELFPQLLLARWQRYPYGLRRLLAFVLPQPAARQRLVARSAAALASVERGRLPVPLRHPIYRLAYHLHFWQGLAQTADRDELRELLGRLNA